MSSEARLFFTSDPHYGHKNVISLCQRPFTSLDEMHEELIRRYNSVVGPADTCIWVGDCFFMTVNKARSIMDRLNGTKILVRGNHDQSPRRMLNMGFSQVSDELWLQLAEDVQVQVKHYPMQGSPGVAREVIKRLPFWVRKLVGWQERRYAERCPADVGQVLIHGHTHSKRGFVGRRLHVGVDAHDFTPVSAESVVQHVRSLQAK